MRENLAVDASGYIFGKDALFQGQIRADHPIPILGERLSYFVAGPPGCGKSTTVADIVQCFPDLPIYLFSEIKEDRAFKGLKLRRVHMDKDTISKITLDKLTIDGDCFCVFDDVDKIRDPATAKVLQALMDNVIANGRSHGGSTIHVIVTCHALNDYKKTKYAQENCNYWVIFPAVSVFKQIVALLKKEGLEDWIRYIKRERRVFIHHAVPFFICTDYAICGNSI